ncbi:hypothetical protein KJZ71_01555 [Patescibacteria group bacterium]|nr:hypothetical protein [Patescibacteria group bacterium]MDL1952621.1 hypothetical protein [Candidatus Uhrbacteria bacterium UHB]RIL01247.1 MAG: hypothetical protein DCC77_01770 [Candidatus Uhrbacteria bacterium]
MNPVVPIQAARLEMQIKNTHVHPDDPFIELATSFLRSGMDRVKLVKILCADTGLPKAIAIVRIAARKAR